MGRLYSTIMMTALLFAAGPAMAQEVRTIDPNQAIDADLSAPRGPDRAAEPAQSSTDRPPAYPPYDPQGPRVPAAPPATGSDQQQDVARDGATAIAEQGDTFNRAELLSAAEGTLGKGTAGLAGMLEKILKDQGQPNAYIAGREAGGAFVVGLRYGQGEMFHKIEGQQPVYWTGPSVGFDIGGDASKVFVLVYNLNDTEDLYRKRFAAGEGRLFFVGGVAASYLRKGNQVVIPIRLGVGWRQGVNIGYMKFSHDVKWFPF
ncbi:DUF1134 domain-containing protein [Sphingomonas sp. PB4P5]|uniref:DUF1134 domain-containing protein n=1 Tax=Parasphingomonas puruogangriensis TaxID=3096155 RepID=UPI002FCC96BF